MDPAPDPDPAIFASDFQDVNKNIFFLKFFSLLLLEGTFTSVFKDKTSFRKSQTIEIKAFFQCGGSGMFIPDPGS